MFDMMEEGWFNALAPIFKKPYMDSLTQFLKKEYQDFVVFPQAEQVYNAFRYTPFEKVRVVILGQDPYHNEGQAHGLAFSVPKGRVPPPSLKNIFKELKSEFSDFEVPTHGDLTNWAEQGVFLLNATLTVRANQAGSHQKKGWESFTDEVIKTLSSERTGLVFLLWGKCAQQKATIIDANKHLVLEAPHPSPLSAYKGFFGCQHFTQANDFLKSNGQAHINWQI